MTSINEFGEIVGDDDKGYSFYSRKGGYGPFVPSKSDKLRHVLRRAHGFLGGLFGRSARLRPAYTYRAGVGVGFNPDRNRALSAMNAPPRSSDSLLEDLKLLRLEVQKLRGQNSNVARVLSATDANLGSISAKCVRRNPQSEQKGPTMKRLINPRLVDPAINLYAIPDMSVHAVFDGEVMLEDYLFRIDAIDHRLKLRSSPASDVRILVSG